MRVKIGNVQTASLYGICMNVLSLYRHRFGTEIDCHLCVNCLAEHSSMPGDIEGRVLSVNLELSVILTLGIEDV